MVNDENHCLSSTYLLKRLAISISIWTMPPQDVHNLFRGIRRRCLRQYDSDLFVRESEFLPQMEDEAAFIFIVT